MIKVSVIVPIYNTEQYLPRCIDSLINQTLENIEIILVNDASPDNSIKIMREYEEKYPEKIIIIDSKENLKQGGARNLGIEAAKGEYIGFVDSDDWVDKEMYEELYNKAKETDADIVDSDYVLSYGIGQDYRRTTSNTQEQTGKLDFEKRKSLLIRTGSVACKIYKKEMLNKYNIRFSTKLFYEDNEFVPLTLIYANSLERVDKAFYHYFQNNETSTTTQKDSYHHFDRLITIQNLIDHTKEVNIYEQYKDELDFMFIRLYYVNTIAIAIKKFSKIPIDKLIEMRKHMKVNLPKYYKNKYYKEKISKKAKLRCMLNDISPRLLAFLAKLV